jgi:hypothetical protein
MLFLRTVRRGVRVVYVSMDGPEEVLRPAEQPDERSEGTYTAHLRCSNCGVTQDALLPRGEPVGTRLECENCGVTGYLKLA